MNDIFVVSYTIKYIAYKNYDWNIIYDQFNLIIYSNTKCD